MKIRINVKNGEQKSQVVLTGLCRDWAQCMQKRIRQSRYIKRSQAIGSVTMAWKKQEHKRTPMLLPSHYSSRNAVVTGNRAARTAGNNPPTKPIASAHFKPCQSNSGDTLKAKVSCPTVPAAMVDAV